jgi:type I restriction enzyme, S subunit
MVSTGTSLHESRRELVASAFSRLGDGSSRFALDHIHELVVDINDLKELRQAVHALAVRGKLSEQSKDDEPVSALLERCAVGKKKVTKARRTGGWVQKNTADEGLSLIPESWQYVPLADLTAFHNGFAFKAHTWQATGLPIVRIQNLNKRYAPFNYAAPATVLPKHRIATGDVLLSWSGTPGTSFGVFIWDRGDAALNQHIFKCEFYAPINSRYFQIAVNDRIRQALHTAHGGVGLKHLTKRQLDAMLVPLPPAAEQDRIVYTVDHLEMSLKSLTHLLAPTGADAYSSSDDALTDDSLQIE